jgi:hypothetical protein
VFGLTRQARLALGATTMPLTGYRRVRGELAGLGYQIGASTVWKILNAADINPTPRRAGPSWAQFRREPRSFDVLCQDEPMDGASWSAALREWIAEPCPAGEWVYRGQAARFETIVPSLLRGPNRAFYRNQLFDLDLSIADELLTTSPVFGDGGLFEHMIDNPGERGLESFLYSVLGGPPVILPRLGNAEMVRALAQHYDYPTLFVDVSLDSVVSAMFATHSFAGGAAAVSDEAGVLYRWPARRTSPARLVIQAEAEVDGEEPAEVQVIDISRISPHMRRPRNQSAALAKPVFDPKPLYQPYPSPVDALSVTDLAGLRCCERFELPAGAGATIASEYGVILDALFPDGIDLGYSYVSTTAFLSLTVHDSAHEDQRLIDGPWPAGELRAYYEHALRVGRSLLDRECLRLVEGCPVPESLHAFSLEEVQGSLEMFARTARKAMSIMGEPSVRERSTIALQESSQARLDQRYALWRGALVDTVGAERANEIAPVDPPRVEISFGPQEWISPELNRRLGRVRAIAGRAGYVPAFAFTDRTAHQRFLDALPSDDAYEAEMVRLIDSTRRWMTEALSFRSEPLPEQSAT